MRTKTRPEKLHNVADGERLVAVIQSLTRNLLTVNVIKISVNTVLELAKE